MLHGLSGPHDRQRCGMPSWSTWKELFRISTPVGLVAKLDRAYRLPSGLLVLVEFKTRWSNQPCLSDVIQLSAQRMAVNGANGAFGGVPRVRDGEGADQASLTDRASRPTDD